MMKIGRATPPDIPSRPDSLEFVRPGFGVKVGKAGSLCMSTPPLFPRLVCLHQLNRKTIDNGSILCVYVASRIAILHGKVKVSA